MAFDTEPWLRFSDFIPAFSYCGADIKPSAAANHKKSPVQDCLKGAS